ncbi:MAG: DUF1579 domain-containing protein [Bryobacteraceae bacterium]
MKAEINKEHEWLNKLVGDWTYEAEGTMGPGQPKVRSSGSESIRSLGGIWIVADGWGRVPGENPATMLLTLGYDPQIKKYVGTWIGTTLAYLWVYRGSLKGNVLTLEAEGPSLTGDGALSKYRDVIEVSDHDTRVMKSHVLDEGGSWRCLVTSHYRRVRAVSTKFGAPRAYSHA